MLGRLVDDFEGKLTSSKWAKTEKCSPDTALRDINGLIDRGVLQKDPGGGRSTSYSLVENANRCSFILSMPQTSRAWEAL